MNKSHSLLILEPPYAMVRRLRDEPPALGSVVLVDTTVSRPTSTELRGLLDIAAWCPLCLVADADSGMRSTRRLSRTCVAFGLEKSNDGSNLILNAVASRPRPTPSDMVDWIVRRTHLQNLGRTLSDLFTRPALRKSDLGFLPYAYREQLRLLGDWSAVEWQHAANLGQIAGDQRAIRGLLGAEDLPSQEMRRWIREHLATTEEEFSRRAGWEWVLEAALRRSGYFEVQESRVRRYAARPSALLPYAGWTDVTGGVPCRQTA
jgi:hypothetical protein